MHISIIVCCYNSENRIYKTLESLSKQNIYNLTCELVLIDNNCTDNTVDLALKAWEDNGFPFILRIIQESNPGLSNARKVGVLSAQGEIIIFCDDDNWLNENYIINAFQLFRNDSNLFGACGYCEPVANIDLPEWFEEYSTFYACGLPQIENNELLALRGAGMVVRSSALKLLYESGIRHFSTDRKGNSLSSGGDDEISFWLKSLGGKILYDNSLTLKHFIEDKRLVEAYRTNLVQSIRTSTIYLRTNIKLMMKADQKWRKRDFINMLLPGYIGKLSRLRLGIYGKTNIYFANKKILDKVKTNYHV
jgi:glycosyltransferase involved in cell wall biosynthesis